MRTLTRIAAAGALVTPLILGGATLAAADDGGPSYAHAMNGATAHGGFVTKTFSGFYPDGTAYFYKITLKAGPHGAMSSGTGSHS